MLLYGFVWFGRNSEAEVKTINEWKRLCSREWKRLWNDSEQSVSESVSNQGRHRAARAAKNVKIGLNCDVCTVCNVRGYLWVQGGYLGV